MGDLALTSLLEAAVAVGLFIGLLFVGSLILPGRRIVGHDTEGKERIYVVNGLTLLSTTVIVTGLVYWLNWFSLAFLYEHFLALFVVANILAFVWSGWQYWSGVRKGHDSPGFLAGYFYGVEASATWFGLDLKFFSYRPSLIGLALLNASFAVVQYETYGSITLAMGLYQAFTLLYVTNYFQFESGMLHTWDLVSERFGWMLIWGDYVLVPFFYCLPAWYLVHATDPLPALGAVGISALFLFGFWLFRTANQQKHDFKCNPNVRIWGRQAQTLEGRLLVSGVWGIGRHLNYTGEICVYFAFALTTGFVSWVPFLLPLWLTCLLLHRSVRDERRCRAKYGALWDRYTRKARFAMIPFVH